ncbi:MAG: adenosine deaminase [Clostridiales bacterium]|nr:adenosine deaminase [Clostridiales bacterium]
MPQTSPVSPPLIELHLHLDGAITVDIARNLAALQDIILPAKDDETLLSLLSVPPSCRSLDDFLKCFTLPLNLLQTADGLREAVRLVQAMLRRQGVVYAELRFAPQLHCTHGMTQRQAIEAALTGLSQNPLPCGLILCLMRGAAENDNRETIDLAAEYLVSHDGVVALDLAGAEGLFPTCDYAALFARAEHLHIPFTIHAGEAAGSDSIRAAIDMGARRIGHGVRLREDPDLLEAVRRLRLPLELCPTSNYQTHAVDERTPYPLKDYLDAGLAVTVNTDDMAICRTTLAGEFDWLQVHGGITRADEKKLLLHAAEAAFTDSDTRRDLITQVEHYTTGHIPHKVPGSAGSTLE